MDTADIILRAALVGIGGTIVLDLYAFLMRRMFGIPAGNWKMVGRWLGHMSKCAHEPSGIDEFARRIDRGRDARALTASHRG